MYLNRRNFLKFASLASFTSPLGLLASCSHQKFYNPDQDILLGGGKFIQNDKLRHVLAITNLQQQDSKLIDLDFLTHGIIIDPKDKQRLLAFEKNGANAVAVGLSPDAPIQKISTTPDKQFNGHAAYDKTGNTLFCTETYLKDGRGIISIREGKSFDVIDEFSSYGENPHECQLTNDGATIVVTNTGSAKAEKSPASISYIDMQSKKLIERVTLSNQQLNAGHIAIADDGSLIVASAAKESLEDTEIENTLGGVSMRTPQQAMLTMSQPEVVINQLTGEALSVIIDNKHRVAAITHPEANMVTFWSINKRELIKAMSVPQPRGITLSLDGNAFIISYDINTSVVKVKTKDLSADPDSILQPTYISGAHIYNWSKILRQIMPTNVYT